MQIGRKMVQAHCVICTESRELYLVWTLQLQIVISYTISYLLEGTEFSDCIVGLRWVPLP